VEIRIDEIKRQVAENPVAAIDLIRAYRHMYGIPQDGETQGISQSEIPDRDVSLELVSLETEAGEKLRGLYEKAVADEKWNLAASLGRSLANLENTETPQAATDREGEFALAFAKSSLEAGDNINAFLAGAFSHKIRRLSADDSLLFLERAVEAKQRRTAAFFYAALEQAGGASRASAGLRDFAQGTDRPADMIRGVATVIVDRGFRAQRGVVQRDMVSGSAFFVDTKRIESTGTDAGAVRYESLLITNYHVIESEVDPSFRGNSRLSIRMGDTTSPRIPAKVVGWDKTLDLALLSAPVGGDFVFSLVDKALPGVGDTVRAIGSPLGLEQTITSGIVSSLSRRGILQIGDAIQIDAAINPGNSGGPVIDTSGRLVGVAFAGAPAPFQGLNFAIPAERLVMALPAMLEGERAQRPWLGMVLSEGFSGAEILYTAPNSPAARHGIAENSTIKSINGSQVKAPAGRLIPALQDSLFPLQPGELVAVETVDRDGAVKRSLVMSVARPNLPLVGAAKSDSRERLATPFFGMVLGPGAGRGLTSRFQVERVVRGFVADEAGISQQDTVSIRNFRVFEKEGFVQMEMNIRKRSMGFMESTMQLLAAIDSPDTL
jgi:S1-C subfamily serine protease